MSDTSGSRNADDIPAEERPECFQESAQVSESSETTADQGAGEATPPPADFDPVQQPSNPDLVTNAEPPD